jgi:hypothetical protein
LDWVIIGSQTPIWHNIYKKTRCIARGEPSTHQMGAQKRMSVVIDSGCKYAACAVCDGGNGLCLCQWTCLCFDCCNDRIKMTKIILKLPNGQCGSCFTERVKMDAKVPNGKRARGPLIAPRARALIQKHTQDWWESVGENDEYVLRQDVFHLFEEAGVGNTAQPKHKRVAYLKRALEAKGYNMVSHGGFLGKDSNVFAKGARWWFPATDHPTLHQSS